MKTWHFVLIAFVALAAVLFFVGFPQIGSLDGLWRK